MRIGILTFHRAVNYGAVLQAYALRMYLSSRGHDVFVIDYVPDFLSKEYSFFKKPRRNFFLNINRYLLPIPFRIFLNKRLRLYDFRSDEDLGENFDCLVCGSDQIWNHVITKGTNWRYFLKDIKCSKKISYAASMSDIPLLASDSREIARCLKDFNFIGVRESFAAEHLKNLFNIGSKIVLDPVFLYDFESIAPPSIFKDYIIVFSFQRNDHLSHYIRDLKRRLSIPVIALGVPFQEEADTNKVCVSPEAWLGWIKHARLVLTDSFHCISFSIKFQRSFYYIKRLDRNNRVLELLIALGIENNVLDGSQTLDSLGYVDYESVNSKLEALVNDSKLFLEKALSN